MVIQASPSTNQSRSHQSTRQEKEGKSGNPPICPSQARAHASKFDELETQYRPVLVGPDDDLYHATMLYFRGARGPAPRPYRELLGHQGARGKRAVCASQTPSCIRDGVKIKDITTTAMTLAVVAPPMMPRMFAR